ncbi:MAG: hypothetical protein Q4E03_02930 [Trueperella sp.]|nr:hypothetical protein [Trueperella sp.]
MASQRKLPWKDPRLALGILLIAIGGIAGTLLFGSGATVAVLQARSDIPAGTDLTAQHFNITEVPEAVAKQLVPATELSENAVAGRTIYASEFLSSHALSTSGRDDRVDVGIPLLAPPASSLRPGQEIQVWQIRNIASGREGAQARMLTADAILISVSESESLSVNSQVAQVRLPKADLEAVLQVLGTQDGFAVVGAAQ